MKQTIEMRPLGSANKKFSFTVKDGDRGAPNFSVEMEIAAGIEFAGSDIKKTRGKKAFVEVALNAETARALSFALGELAKALKERG